MNTPAYKKTVTLRKSTTTRTAIELTEEEAAEVLRRHFELSPSATVEFVCSRSEFLSRVVLTDVAVVEDTEETTGDV